MHEAAPNDRHATMLEKYNLWFSSARRVRIRDYLYAITQRDHRKALSRASAPLAREHSTKGKTMSAAAAADAGRCYHPTQNHTTFFNLLSSILSWADRRRLSFSSTLRRRRPRLVCGTMPGWALISVFGCLFLIRIVSRFVFIIYTHIACHRNSNETQREKVSFIH